MRRLELQEIARTAPHSVHASTAGGRARGGRKRTELVSFVVESPNRKAG
jgi:hypothetical protein